MGGGIGRPPSRRDGEGEGKGEAVVPEGSASVSSEAACEPASGPALQVIVLGSGGGPLENNVTAFLVRSLALKWAKGSLLAVDAGVHLSAIKAILEDTQPANLGQSGGPSLPHTLATGPFAGLEVPHATTEANASHIHNHLIGTYLLTHAHLDHIAGFVINTAGLQGRRPKTVAGMPNTITALKTHVFNNVIWPNLSDENNGAGLVTYRRLVNGGSPMVGEGERRGYSEICSGLDAKGRSVSHGHCVERHSHRGSGSSSSRGSADAQAGGTQPAKASPGSKLAAHTSLPTNIGAILQEHERMHFTPVGRHVPAVDERVCVYSSSAYFLRDQATGREILIFGDVEPDSLSLEPRNREVWQDAAPRLAAGNLAAIFIECSYDDSRSSDRLFGHLTPRYVCEEMTALAEEVVAARQELGDVTDAASAAGQKRRGSTAAATTAGDDHPGARTKKRKGSGEAAGSSPLVAKRQSSRHRLGAAASREQLPIMDIPVSPRSLNPPSRLGSTAALVPSDRSDIAQQPQQETPPETLSGDLMSSLNGAADRTVLAAAAHAATAPTDSSSHPSGDQLGSPTSLPMAETETELETETETEAQDRLRNALAGLKVVVIHVKERMADGREARDIVLEELVEHERRAQLGVEYIVSRAGQQFYF